MALDTGQREPLATYDNQLQAELPPARPALGKPQAKSNLYHQPCNRKRDTESQAPVQQDNTYRLRRRDRYQRLQGPVEAAECSRERMRRAKRSLGACAITTRSFGDPDIPTGGRELVAR